MSFFLPEVFFPAAFSRLLDRSPWAFRGSKIPSFDVVAASHGVGLKLEGLQRYLVLSGGHESYSAGVFVPRLRRLVYAVVEGVCPEGEHHSLVLEGLLEVVDRGDGIVHFH